MKQGLPKSMMKLNPMVFVQDAAFRAKIKREEKQQEIAKLELQKETLQHFKEKVAQEMIVIDAPKTRAQENNEKAAFMAHSNIKNNPLLQYNDSHLTMTMQPNKFSVNGWAFKQLSDCKFRSNFMEENLNGRYCNRTLSSKKDVETYKPNKIFSSMYTKAFYNMDNIKFTRDSMKEDHNSRNLVRQSANITSLSRIGTSKGRQDDLDRQSTINHNVLNSRQERRAIDILTRSGALSKTKDDANFPKNDYAPDFVTSLNFNFNTNDIFGPRAKKTPAISLLKSSANNDSELKDAISSLRPFENRRGTQRELSTQKLENEQSQDRARAGFMSSQNLDEEFQLRRQLNNDILKNQYSFWAGMYVKRQSAKNTDLAFGSGRNTMNLGSIRNITDISDIPVVPFGDPRSLTQCLNFSRKQRPYLPEQECSKGGGVKLIGPPNKKDRPQKLKVRQLRSKQQKVEMPAPKIKKGI